MALCRYHAVVLVILLLAGAESCCFADDRTLLLQAAAEKGVWASAQWRRLLHYPRDAGPTGAGKSSIEEGDFFLSPRGRYDPVAEGEATLAQLLNQALDQQKEDVRCRFPARYQFLQHVLAKELSSLPFSPPRCPALEEWLAGINPSGVTLVYPVSYLNNPASMFGHTLLRIDSAEFSPAHPLLSASIGFAARTDGERGMEYALKGIFGGYVGAFTAEPYYLHATRYGQLENRDIWEYPLSLTTEETRLLLLHAWELQQAEFTYFFFDENCSYQLLNLLEVVRPQLRLTDQFSLWTLPVDTVRDLYAALGGGQQVSYRPSLRTQLEQRATSMDGWLVTLARRVVEGEVNPEDLRGLGVSDSDAARVLEFAYTALRYRMASMDDAAGRQTEETLHRLAGVRSTITNAAPQPHWTAPLVRPDQGHDTARMDIGLGWDEQQPFFQVGVRPVLHDLFDPPGGYDQGAEIEVLYPRFRFYPQQQRFELESMKLLNILSVSPVSAVASPLAWKGEVSLRQFTFGDEQQALIADGSLGFGVSTIAGSHTLLFGLLGAELLASDRFADTVDFGPLFTFGAVLPARGESLFGVQGQIAYMGLEAHEMVYDVSFIYSKTVAKNSALRFTLGLHQDFAAADMHASLQWQTFFRL